MMINSAIMSHLTNEELLRALDERKERSPIIFELCRRLEKLDTEVTSIDESSNQVMCPVCMASLLADIDHDNNLFTLNINTH
jgi:hypothetical protein